MMNYKRGDKVEYRIYYTYLGDEICFYNGTVVQVNDDDSVTVHRENGALIGMQTFDTITAGDIIQKEKPRAVLGDRDENIK